MIIDVWKIVTVILGVVLIGNIVSPSLTGLFVGTSGETVSVELFVMSHCPFGTQAEKGIIPVIKALGANVDFKLRFVYYVMHGKTEIDEQLNQYCIQKNEPAKLLDYLACFLEAGNGAGCLTSTGINTVSLSSCVAAADAEFGVSTSFNDQSSWLSGRYPLFNVHKSLNDKAIAQTPDGRWGSPGLMINGVLSSPASRSPQAYLDAICAAFTDKPGACSQPLSNTAYSSGFGYTAGASNTAAQCS